MNLTDYNEIRALLARHGFRFSKSLGQNFLTAAWVPARIADEAGIAGIPAGLSELDDLPIRFTEVIDGNADAIRTAVCVFLDEQAR